MKRMWKEWAVDHIIRTGQCPGEVPSFGLPTDKMTLSEFQQTVASMGTHKHTDCHFVKEILGVADTIEEMKEIGLDIPKSKYMKEAGSLKKDVSEVHNSKKLAKLKENLHLYTNRIHFKSNGSLSVPKPLLNIEEYINGFFS